MLVLIFSLQSESGSVLVQVCIHGRDAWERGWSAADLRPVVLAGACVPRRSADSAWQVDAVGAGGQCLDLIHQDGVEIPRGER